VASEDVELEAFLRLLAEIVRAIISRKQAASGQEA
jgi:hypothetical protein